MDISHDSLIRHPRDLVFRTYRDHLTALVPLIPNVASIQVEERTEEGDRVSLVNHWRAQGTVPRAAQGIIKPEMLTWTDRALWNEEEWSCAWEFETHFLPGKIQSRGKNYFISLPDGTTRVEIRGSLRLPENGLPGIPNLLARSLVPQIERFVVALVTPNMVKVTDGLEQYLNETTGRR